MKKNLTINSDFEMQALGEKIGQQLTGGEVILLEGDLGAGKTTWTKGLARALGVKRPVKSPTFTIVREYRNGRLPLFHMDMYRLEDGDTSSIDLDDYFSQGGVVVMEWPNFVADQIPAEHLVLKISRDDEDLDSTKRTVEISGTGSEAEKIIENI